MSEIQKHKDGAEHAAHEAFRAAVRIADSGGSYEAVRDARKVAVEAQEVYLGFERAEHRAGNESWEEKRDGDPVRVVVRFDGIKVRDKEEEIEELAEAFGGSAVDGYLRGGETIQLFDFDRRDVRAFIRILPAWAWGQIQ